jgi:hypothetical protein
LWRPPRRDVKRYAADEFPWDPLQFHSCANRFAVAYVVAASRAGAAWHALVVCGKQSDIAFRTRIPIAKEKIFKWLSVRGHETGVWRSKLMDPLDFTPPAYGKSTRANHEPPGYVYFLRDVITKLIKIGYSMSPYDRQTRIQGMCSGELSWIGAFRADRSFEAHLHRYFLCNRAHGEWFRETPELTEFIREEATS